MKEGWEYKKLGEVCNVIGGGTPDTKNKDYWRGNIPWATVSDMNCDVIKTTGYYITARGLNESSSRIIKKGEIIIATRVGLGKVCKLAVDTAINQDLKGIIPKDNNIVRDFIFYYFKHKAKYIVDNGIGATVKGVKIKFIEGLSFGFPSLSEQQSIVDYLDSAFAKIDAMKANAAKALYEAKTLFQAFLKEMLEPKEGWEKKALGELSDKIGDGLHGTPKYTDDGEYFFVNGNNLENGIIEIKDNTKRINHDEYEKFKLDLNSSTVLLSINGTIGKTAFYNGEPIILGKSACYINVLPALLKEYLRYYLVSDGFFNYVKSNSRQATITNLGLKEIRRMPIPTPSLDEQQSIVATLDSLKSKVDKLQENYDKISQECDALKQAILKQVFE